MSDNNSKDGIGELNDVVVEGCDEDQDQCEVELGQDVNISITFTTKALIKTACAKVEANVMGLKVDVKKEPEKICENENSGVKCPLNQGLIFTYKGTAKVPNLELLKTVGEADVYWRLMREDEKSEERKRREAGTPPTTEIVCVQIPVKIKK
ncbi:hypothetical protein HCN44_001623 [Aphidius gifuensis]|uniref:MD-2-related lipid-recognition domain-containing protein n=1 Tax=Aphidius gifuensis TaxID=684658 RepID=A0A835CSI3_APHGI|nr:hypothetical protein HCN44_001623 [Aphidius gifuensis]